jgi:hypothetical protein
LALVANIPQGCDMLKQTEKDLLPKEHGMVIKIECIGFGGVNYIPEGCEQVDKAISQGHR